MSAQEIKDEGNTLISSRRYTLAILKYTALDKDNAILYANRAACRLHTKEYLDVASGAKIATNIDPMYTKAWVRFATALDFLDEPYRSINAWKKALDTLPSAQDSSAAVDKQRKSFESSLGDASSANDKLSRATPPLIYMTNTSKHPWVAAKELIPILKASNIRFSSAWVIPDAYQAS